MSEMRMNGRVKWFDSKKGYGFVETTCESPEDLFIHFSNIKTRDSNAYKKLFPGEYVSFLKEHDSDNDRDECRELTGIDGGILMTENPEYRFKVFKNYNYSNSTNDNTDPEIAEVLNDDADDADNDEQ